MKFFFILSLLIVHDLFAGEIGEKAPFFNAKTASGKEINLGNFRGKVIVLEWLNHGCPFVKKHYESGHMQKLQKRYTDQGVIWLSVISSAVGKQGHSSPDKAKEDKKRVNSFATYVVLDETGEIGVKYSAKTTPHMFVIDKKGDLVYQGAIDNMPSTNIDDINNSINYLSNALDEVLKGQKVVIGKTRPYGCSIKY